MKDLVKTPVFPPHGLRNKTSPNCRLSSVPFPLSSSPPGKPYPKLGIYYSHGGFFGNFITSLYIHLKKKGYCFACLYS